MWDRLGQNDIVRLGKNSGPNLSRLWTKVHEICGQRRRPFVLSNARLPGYLCHVSFSRYSPLSLEVLEKLNKCKSFMAPIFRERRPQLLYDRLLARPTAYRVANCGWVPFADLRLRSLAMKWNADFTEGGWKLTSNLKPFMDRSSRGFEPM